MPHFIHLNPHFIILIHATIRALQRNLICPCDITRGAGTARIQNTLITPIISRANTRVFNIGTETELVAIAILVCSDDGIVIVFALHTGARARRFVVRAVVALGLEEEHAKDGDGGRYDGGGDFGITPYYKLGAID